MYPVLENTSYPSERTQTERRWSNFKPSKMAVNRTNNMGGATLPSCIRSYQTPVTPVRGHGRERWGAILSRLSKMAVNRTWEMLHRGHVSGRTKHPVTLVRGHTERRWSNFKPSKMAVKRTNKQHGRCYTAVMYPVLPNTSYPSERTRP